ncbi:hypothetical protein OG585_49760 (plasmid) [Streptomyces sp. NBC_01340]|nr:hypothetical protein OG585_49760 [Streptomyces sp. NBC_01340]
MTSRPSQTAGTSGADAGLAAIDNPYVTGTVLHVDGGARLA